MSCYFAHGNTSRLKISENFFLYYFFVHTIIYIYKNWKTRCIPIAGEPSSMYWTFSDCFVHIDRPSCKECNSNFKAIGTQV